MITKIKDYLKPKSGISTKRKNLGILLILSMISLWIVGGTITGALTVYNFTVENTGVTTSTDQIIPVNLSGDSISTHLFTNTSMLNSNMHQGSLDIRDMPASAKIDLVGAFDRASANDLTDSTSTTTNDMDLPYAVGEKYHFALHNPARILHLTVGQATNYTLTTVWSYCAASDPTQAATAQCTSWVPFAGVSDSTSAFTEAGKQTVSWTVPEGGLWVNQTYQNTLAHWVQVEVTVASASTIKPLGTQSTYETGQWWMFVDSIESGQVIDYQLYVGGSNIKTYHHYFPGYAGVVTADAAALEPGGDWNFEIQQNLKVDTNEAGKIIGKTGAFDLDYQSASSIGGNNQITMGVTGSASNTFYSIFKHSEEDGAGYYSGTSEESHSKTFYNGSSNYITSHREDASDVLSNSDSSITSHKIGQAYDKTIDTTPAIGAKINDPS